MKAEQTQRDYQGTISGYWAKINEPEHGADSELDKGCG